ncbi:MAG: class II aldolase [Ponticaulis sp.]|nr:class II aldolase [Ponticaulis sp.]
MSSFPEPTPTQEITVRKAARAIGRARLAHAYGHCSQRLDADYFLVCAPEPMALVTPEMDGVVVPVSGPLPEGVLGEVRIHQQIYQRRPDVSGITRTMPPNSMALAALGKSPRIRHGFGSYFHAGFPFWDDPQLLRSDEQAEQLAEMFGDASALLMRGNGLVTASDSLEKAVVLAWYAEDAARIELEALKCGLADSAPTLSQDEARQRATDKGRIFERMWDYLTHGDPET